MPLSSEELEAFCRGAAPVIVERIRAETAPLVARIAALEADLEAKAEATDRIKGLLERVSALEQRPAALRYAGVWRSTAYEQDAGVTHDGSLWVARRATKPGEHPGDNSLAWQLAVKKGRNA
jgi:hypothetical protein